MAATGERAKRRILKKGLIALVLALILAQLVPYGRSHESQPATAEPEWNHPDTRATFFRACADCHSNQTHWPWYSHVAPASWLIQHDVDEGREHLNVSEWGRRENHGDEAAETVREGEMPLWYYLPLHPEARLTDAQKRAFVEGLVATFGERSHERHQHGADG